ncbi:MAG: asparagine synthase (glutamine-hydrolyzing) [Candidatus Omnitrophica bacterium]|nr:asparagine synthase (glutamine-hydrolyzing) [Candidatus Omnitrophota bacterium]
MEARKVDVVRSGRKIIHRGPDDEGCWSDSFYSVYFRRLSIIDTSYNGHQPMLSDDGRYVLVFNGEIYNHPELRERLALSGHVFRTSSDTEVLLRHFQEYGPEGVLGLRGMFAFAVWDRASKELHLFRDRVGIKPLFLYSGGGTTLFASEIKCLLEYLGDGPGIDEETVFRYLAKGWADDTSRTFFKDIVQVPPASYVKINVDARSVVKYWSLKYEGARKFEREGFLDIFSRAVSLHLRSDVPLAATLSGGMDSSSIVALAAKSAASPEQIRAFSVIPPETIDESFWIDETARYTGITHSYLDMDLKCLSGVFGDVLSTHDEPFQSSSCIYQYLLRKKVSEKGIKVLLVGEGGDEVFGGYRRLLYPFLYSLLKDGRRSEYDAALSGAVSFMGIPRDIIEDNLLKYKGAIRSKQTAQENTTAYDILDADFKAEHSLVAKISHYPGTGDSGNCFVEHLRQHLFVRDLPYVLRMEDRNSMAFGIEARVPMLDHILLEEVFKYDYSEFMAGGMNKSMLRRAMTGHLPEGVTGRKSKSPRPGNNSHFMYTVLKDELLDILDPTSPVGPGFLVKGARELFRSDLAGRNAERAESWFRVFVFLRWYDIFKGK